MNKLDFIAFCFLFLLIVFFIGVLVIMVLFSFFVIDMKKSYKNNNFSSCTNIASKIITSCIFLSAILFFIINIVNEYDNQTFINIEKNFITIFILFFIVLVFFAIIFYCSESKNNTTNKSR